MFGNECWKILSKLKLYFLWRRIKPAFKTLTTDDIYIVKKMDLNNFWTRFIRRNNYWIQDINLIGFDLVEIKKTSMTPSSLVLKSLLHFGQLSFFIFFCYCYCLFFIFKQYFTSFSFVISANHCKQSESHILVSRPCFFL